MAQIPEGLKSLILEYHSKCKLYYGPAWNPTYEHCMMNLASMVAKELNIDVKEARELVSKIIMETYDDYT